MEITRGYVLEHDEERYSARRQKIYTFMKIPRELENFMFYGVLQCIDSFLYIHTFLPVRYVMAMWGLITRPLAVCFGLRRRGQRLLTPAEICDLLKGTIWIISALILSTIDTNRIYHEIKSQSVIKLYIFYNMLEVGDRLLSAFGQDTIDALFWTATEPKNRSRAHLGVVSHIAFAMVYILLHSFLIMFQATTLNVAINSNNKGLLGIMMSNNFVELKGSVFKKFDKNNLFQLTCSDVRERIHLTVLLFVVVIQTMKEFNWRLEQLFILLPDCLCVLFVELLIDWVKHAFITRFNELPSDVYKEYTISLAYDMTQTRQKHAFSDHSDLVARRMGFIPFPLGVVLIKALYSAIKFENAASICLFILAYFMLASCRILTTIFSLGRACSLMQQHQNEKSQAINTPIGSSGAAGSAPTGCGLAQPLLINGTQTPASKNRVSCSFGTTDTATSPVHSFVPIQRSQTVDIVTTEIKITRCSSPTTNETSVLLTDPNLGATALFSNSDVDLEDICLNENVLNISNDDVFDEQPPLTRSVPDLQQESGGTLNKTLSDEAVLSRRTHKRSESEPSIQSAHLDGVSSPERS